MRACGACFFYRPHDHDGGECFNRPPQAYTVNYGVDPDSGRPDLETFAVRPPVAKDDFCNFFSHKEKKHE